jgi:hypothetical protein
MHFTVFNIHLPTSIIYPIISFIHEATCIWNGTFNQGITNGNDSISTMLNGIDTVTKCQALCIASPTCKYFFWYQPGSSINNFACQLITNMTLDNLATSSGIHVTFGLKSCPSNCSSVNIVTNFNNPVATQPNTVSDTLCQEMCILYTGTSGPCTIFVWSSSDSNKCRLYTLASGLPTFGAMGTHVLTGPRTCSLN